MSVRSQAYRISVFKRYYSDQHFSEFYLGPTIGVNLSIKVGGLEARGS